MEMTPEELQAYLLKRLLSTSAFNTSRRPTKDDFYAKMYGASQKRVDELHEQYAQFTGVDPAMPDGEYITHTTVDIEGNIIDVEYVKYKPKNKDFIDAEWREVTPEQKALEPNND